MRPRSGLDKLLHNCSLLAPMLEVCAISRGKAMMIRFPSCKAKELSKDVGLDPGLTIASDLAAQLADSITE